MSAVLLSRLNTEVVANCDHLSKLKFSKTLPFAFTEFGAIALANVLASTQAIEMGIYVVRAFVQLRQATAINSALARNGCLWTFTILGVQRLIRQQCLPWSDDTCQH